MTGGASTPAGGGGGFNAWWQSLKGHPQATNVHTNVRTTVQRLKKAKWGMPVDVKIDFLRPTIEMLNDSLQQAYRQLPPRLQEAAPQIGVALASGLIVFAIQQRRLSNQRQANLAMQQELVLVKRERNELRQRVSTLKVRKRPRVLQVLCLLMTPACWTPLRQAPCVGSLQGLALCVPCRQIGLREQRWRHGWQQQWRKPRMPPPQLPTLRPEQPQHAFSSPPDTN